MIQNTTYGVNSLANLLNGTKQPVQPGLLGANLGGSINSTSTTSPWAYVTTRFTKFIQNLNLTEAQLVDGATKFKGVVSTLNAAYYGTNSEIDHAFYIGSWAKHTRIRPPRDVDLYFLLPAEVHNRFEKYNGNKQSALLQEVKSKLLASYPLSEINGDGPVVLAAFWSFNVEVVPAFALQEDRTYWVPKTQNGGSYMVTKPLHEVDAIETADKLSDSNVRKLIRMLKCWQANCNVELRSFYLELLAIEFMGQWIYKDKSYFYYDWMCRDFFAWLITKAGSFLLAPGTFETLWIGDTWKIKAETASSRALKACDYEHNSKEGDAGEEWQKIFGADVPKWV